VNHYHYKQGYSPEGLTAGNLPFFLWMANSRGLFSLETNPLYPPSEGRTGGSCCAFISERKITLKYSAAFMTSVQFQLPNIFQRLHNFFFLIYLFIFRLKKLKVQLFLRYLFSVFGRVGVNALVLHKNKQTLYIQRDPHSFIEIGLYYPLYQWHIHNCTVFLEKSQSSFTVFLQCLLKMDVRKNETKLKVM